MAFPTSMVILQRVRYTWKHCHWSVSRPLRELGMNIDWSGRMPETKKLYERCTLSETPMRGRIKATWDTHQYNYLIPLVSSILCLKITRMYPVQNVAHKN